MSYGIGYKGSKSRIADLILSYLPDGKRFCDLFGGGGAMSHAAALSGKYESVLYNEIEPTLPRLLRDAVAGCYSYDNFRPRWISRQEFHDRKAYDGYIRYIWSFSCNGDNYLCGQDGERRRRAAFNALTADTMAERRAWLKKYTREVRKADAPQNPTVEPFERLERLQALQGLRNIDFHCGSYTDYEHIDGDIVYCDIPYQTSVTNKTYCKGFDWPAFYDWARTRPYQVYFSSYEIAESDFYSTKLCDKTSGFSASNNSLVRAEYLYSNMPFKVFEQCTIF